MRSVLGLLLLALVMPACSDEPAVPDCDPTGERKLTVESQRVPAKLTELSSVPGLTSGEVVEGELWLTQRNGRLLHLDLRSGSVEELLDMTSVVTVEGEGGLLDLSVDPNDDRLYLSYLDSEHSLNVVSFDGLRPFRLHDAEQHLVVEHPSAFHVGGSMDFGPDGFLYVGVGDGSLPSQTTEQTAAQDLDSLRGKLLRIDPERGGGYGVPGDNPFEATAAGEVWLYGLRNPWAFSFDPVSGDLWLPDVGEACWEEINFVGAGDGGWNMGWPLLEGTSARASAPDRYMQPVYEYGHDFPGSAVIGGTVYHGADFPELAGAYLFADHGLGTIFALTMEGGIAQQVRRIDVSIPNPTRLISLPDGEAAVLSATAGAFLVQPAD